MNLSKILKRNSVVIDSTKKFPIPISGTIEEEIEQDIEQEPAEGIDFQLPEMQETQDIQEIAIISPIEAINENIQEKPEEKQPAEQPRQEYDFEDFNFSELSDIETQETETQSEEEIAAEQFIESAQLRGEEIIQYAAQTAELIITHTLDNTKAELSNAITAGYTDGFETGRNEALKIVEPALNKINILTETISRLQDKMLYEFRDSMFNIISEISNKIVHKEINENNYYLVGLFSDAIQDIKAEEFVTITVAESEVTVAMRNQNLFLAEIPHIKDFKILADKNAGKGTMIVETEKTVADASVDVQLERVNYYLEQMKEKLNIPQTLDDIINQDAFRSINNPTDTDTILEEDYSEDDGSMENLNFDKGIDTGVKNNININENNMFKDIENSEDISDEEIMKYFNSPDFNVD